MSKHETPLTLRYWSEVGGTLVEEFLVVPASGTCAKRLLDGLILPNGPNERVSSNEVEIAGQDVIVVQTKAKRLGMYLLGQAVFSAELIKRHNPKSVRTVAICTEGDSALEPLARDYGVEIVVYPAEY
jgi:hypothetical protein